MEANKKRKLHYGLIISVLASIVSSFALGYGFSGFKFVQIDSISQIIANKSKNNSLSKTYLTYYSSEKSAETLFGSTRSYNFSNYFGELISYNNQDDTLARFNFGCANTSISDVAICNALTYSNNVNLKRFETININLYKTPDPEERNSYGLDGFIYIPDYFADAIIKNDENLNNYLDLLPNLSLLTSDERTLFLDKYSIVISDFNATLGRFKIANIFHVDGFSDELYEYTDRGAGSIFKAYLGNYAICCTGKLNSYKKGIVSYVDSKRFIVENEINKYINYSDGSEFSLKFHTVSENQDYKNHDIIYSVDNENLTAINPVHIIAIVLAFIFLLASLLVFYRIYKLLKPIEIISFSVAPILIFEFIIQLLYATCLSNSLMFLSIYNLLFNLPLLFYFVFNLFLLMKGRLS